MKTKNACGPAQVCFQDLADIHTRRHAKRVEYDLNRRSIRQVRHVLFRQNTCDDTLVAVTAGHLIANAQFAFHRDENLDHLDHARRQFVALLELGDLLVVDIGQDVDLALGTLFVFANFSRDVDRAG